MAAYIPVPRDLTQVKPKVALNLTKRQIICFAIAAAIGLPSFFVIKHFAGTTAATAAMIVVMLPMFFIAMYERNGQFIETILRHYLEAALIRPKIRPYRTDNYYSAMMREEKVEEEVKRIVELSEKHVKEASDKKKGKGDGTGASQTPVKSGKERNQRDRAKGTKA